jgi:hypothetical protein
MDIGLAFLALYPAWRGKVGLVGELDLRLVWETTLFIIAGSFVFAFVEC